MSKLPKNTPSVEQEEILYTLYYKDNFTFGRDRLYKYIQEHFPNSKISRRMVYNWLSRQELHQRFQQVRHTKNIQHTVLEEPKKQIGIDLVNMEHYEHNGYKYILTGIDFFSKKAYARPLKDKEAKTVTKAMEDLIKNEIHYVSSIRSDNGSEFIADDFKKLLDKYEIKQVFSLAGKPQSNGQIENFNKTLKRALIMGMKINKNNDWISILHKIINNFNESIHSVTKHKPNDLDIEDDDDILDDVKDEILDSAKIKNATEILFLTKNDYNNLLGIITAKHLNNNIKIITRSNDIHIMNKMKRAGASLCIIPEILTGAEIGNILVSLSKPT